MSCFQAISPTNSPRPSAGVYVSSYHHHPHLHIPSTSPALPAPRQKSSWHKMEVESPSQRWCMNDGPNDVSATQRSVLNSSLNSATTKRSNRYPHGVTSSSLPSDDTEQTPENAEYLGSNCVLLTYFSGDIDSHVDEHFSRALAHLQQQQQQQKVICPASNAGAVHHSSSSLSDGSTVKDCKASSHWKASHQRPPSSSSAYYTCPNRTQYLSTSIVDVGVPHENAISSFDDWRYSFGAAFTNGAYDHRRIRGFGRSQINPLIRNSFNTALNFQNGGDRHQSAINARWTPYERWRRTERTADDTSSFNGCDRALSRSSVGGLTSSCQLQLPSASKQPHTSDLYWF